MKNTALQAIRRLACHKTFFRKICLVMLLQLAALLLLGFALLFAFYYWRHINFIGSDYREIARVLADSVRRYITLEANEAGAVVRMPVIEDAVTQSNRHLSGRTKMDIMRDADKINAEWLEKGGNGDVAKQIMASSASRYLKRYLNEKQGVWSEIFVTDAYGMLVAASGVTSDYFQADEEWWQKAYNQGKGKLYISGLEYDESSRSFGVAVARPLYDEQGAVIGIVKCIVAQGYLNTLVESDLRIQYGHVLMVDGDGAIVLDSSMLPSHLNKKLDTDLVNCLIAHRRDGFMVSLTIMGSPAVIGFSPVYLGSGKNEELVWYILYGRTLQSVSFLLGMSDVTVGIVFIVLAVLLVAMTAASGRYLLRPLRVFASLAESVGQGKYPRIERLPAEEEFSQLTVLYNELIDIVVQRERALSHRAIEMNALCDIGRVIVGEKNYPAAVDRILGMVVERHGMAMDSAVCALYAVDIAAGRLVLRGHGGLMQPALECDIKSLPEEVVTTIIDRKQALYAAELEPADALIGLLGIMYGAAAFHAGYVYPVISKSGILGLLVVAGVSRLMLTGDEHKVMRIVCDEVAQGMENEKLFKDMFERHWEMYWLHEAALIVCEKRDIKECIAAMAKIMTASCKAEKIIFVPVGRQSRIPAPGEAYGFYGDSGVIVEHDVIDLMHRFANLQGQDWPSDYETINLDAPFLAESKSWHQFRKHVSAGLSIPVRFPNKKRLIGVYYIFSDKQTGMARERYLKMLLTYVSYLEKTLDVSGAPAQENGTAT